MLRLQCRLAELGEAGVGWVPGASARGWSDKKKTYCCNAEKKGCFSCLKVSESPEWKPAHRR